MGTVARTLVITVLSTTDEEGRCTFETYGSDGKGQIHRRSLPEYLNQFSPGVVTKIKREVKQR